MDINRAGLALAISGAALFALRPVLVKLIYAYQIDALTIMTWRMAFALPCYLIVLIWLMRQERATRCTPAAIAGAAGIGVIGYYLAAYFDLLGLQYVSAQLGRLILYTYPTIVTLLGWWLFRQRVTGRIWLALLISYSGVALILLHDLNTYGAEVLTGAAWILASAFCFSLYLLCSKPLITLLGSLRFTCIAMIAASVVIMLQYAATYLLSPSLQAAATIPVAPALGLIFLMSIASTVVPSFLISAAIARIGSSKTSITGSFGPAMTSLFAVMLLGESFTVFHLIGLIMVIGAIALSSVRKAQITGN